MHYSYVSLLATEEYLAGILVLHHSLRKSGSPVNLLVLITYKASGDTLSLLDSLGIHYCLADPIPSPYRQTVNTPLYHVFDKLSIFGLVEYDKVVFLDSDMLVCRNIDDLFERPSWSAVNAGGMLPEYAHWNQLNAGLLVIEPNLALFNDLLRKKDLLSSKDRGDQGFLHAYFPEWPLRPELHLDHAYNMYVGFVGRYHERYGYTLPGVIGGAARAHEKEIRVLHFWADQKPWRKGRNYAGKDVLEGNAHRLWWTCFEELLGTATLKL